MIRELLAIVLLAGVAAGAEQLPPRAVVRPAAIGSGVISGVVVTPDQDPRPVGRVRVTLTGLDVDVSHSTVTDNGGGFTLAGLPAGRFVLAAAKPGFVRAEYGARRAGSGATPIVLADGQRVDNVTIAIARGAVIAGMVTDEYGLPAADLDVHALRYERRAGSLQMVPSFVPGGLTRARTDDRGAFRFYGLPAGSYAVVAVPPPGGGSEIRAMSEASPSVGFAPVYFPGVTSAASATAVTVSAGEERTGVDFQLQIVQTSRIEGTVLPPAGVSAGSVHLVMTPADGPLMPAFVNPDAMRIGAVSADGRFSFTGVAPGRYVIAARSGGTGVMMMGSAGEAMRSFSLRSFRNGPAIEGPAEAQDATPYWGQADVVANGFDIDGIVLAMQPGMTMTGRVTFEGTAPPGDIRAVVSLVPAGAPYGPAMGAVHQATAVGPGGTFAIPGVTPGRYSLTALLVPGPDVPVGSWTLKSATAGGRDLIDFPIEIGPGADLSGTALTFTSVSQEVSGTILDTAGRPRPATPSSSSPPTGRYWTSSRRVLTARSATDGRFLIANPPAGSYRLAAVTEVAPDELGDPVVLERLAAGSLPLAVAEGERVVQDVRIGTAD